MTRTCSSERRHRQRRFRPEDLREDGSCRDQHATLVRAPAGVFATRPASVSGTPGGSALSFACRKSTRWLGLCRHALARPVLCVSLPTPPILPRPWERASRAEMEKTDKGFAAPASRAHRCGGQRGGGGLVGVFPCAPPATGEGSPAKPALVFHSGPDLQGRPQHRQPPVGKPPWMFLMPWLSALASWKRDAGGSTSTAKRLRPAGRPAWPPQNCAGKALWTAWAAVGARPEDGI